MKTIKIRPFRLAEEILETLLFRAVEFGALCDYADRFEQIAEDYSPFHAHGWYFLQIMVSIPYFIFHSVTWSLIMLKNYLLIAFRNLGKQKAYSFINIFGLAAGMAGFALLTLSGSFKANADRFHHDAERIYGIIQELRPVNQDEKHTGFLPAPLLPAVINDIPEIEDGVRILPAGRMALRHGDDSFYENHIYFVDPNFLTFFTFEMVSGHPERALQKTHSIVLTEMTALKYFGDENPIGEVLSLGRGVELTVTGVLKNIKRTSSLRFNFLISMETAASVVGFMDDWTVHRTASFVRLTSGALRTDVDEKLEALLKNQLPAGPESAKRLYVFPMLDMRLKASHIQGIIPSSLPATVYAITFIGALLLLIVSINFINLTMARHMYRMKEIGVRKVVGARRSHVMAQLLGESIFISFLALPLAILLYEVLHPFLSNYIGAPTIMASAEASKSIWNYPFTLKYLAWAALLTGLFSGLYPALKFSAYRPVQVLHNKMKTKKIGGRGRRILIVLQFSISIILIVVAGILKNQMQRFVEADLGYHRDGVITLNTENTTTSQREILKTEILRHPDIISVSAAGSLPIVWSNNQQVRPLDLPEDQSMKMDVYPVGIDFIETMGMQMVAGRTFMKKDLNENGLILNHAALEKLGWEEPIGRQLVFGEKTGTVIGLVDDYIFDDIGFEVPPAILTMGNEQMAVMLIKLRAPERFDAAEMIMKEKWQALLPDLPLEISSLNKEWDFFFGLVDKIAMLFQIFGMVAVGLSCLGLLGMSSYIVERRTKEIGIRKVLGASLSSVLWSLMREFLILVVIANCIAMPILFLGWREVLKTGLLFITQIDVGTYVFAVSVTVLMTIIAIISQTLKAALDNPVRALRYE